MRKLGYTLDAVIIATALYFMWNSRLANEIRDNGVMGFVTSLPSAAGPSNGGILVELNKEYSIVNPVTAFQAQRWYNFVLGSDVGRLGRSANETGYFVWANNWKNNLILPRFLQDSLPHTIACWARNMLAGWALYYITGSLWALWIYVLNWKAYFKTKDDMPEWADVRVQIIVSSSAMVFYSLAPTIGEWAIERGLTKAYHDIDAVGGWGGYAFYFVMYTIFFEWGIYWVHRILHIEPLYSWFHRPHHIYNNRNSLSPFAGLAFDPLDGLMQASPYLVGLFVLPVHFWTHEALLFFTGIWTTNIHDTLTGDTEPVMGSAYHTIHHTTYKNNYGQIFVIFDYLHDTLAPPEHRRKQWGWNTPTGRDYGVDYAALGAKKTA